MQLTIVLSGHALINKYTCTFVQYMNRQIHPNLNQKFSLLFLLKTLLIWAEDIALSQFIFKISTCMLTFCV